MLSPETFLPPYTIEPEISLPPGREILGVFP